MRVIILGGGTAGWMAAATLARTHNRHAPVLEITLVESPTVGRIGVGEATTPAIKKSLQRLGIDERHFLRRTGATFKHGIRFEGWSEEGHSYFHPFEGFSQQAAYRDLTAHWLASRAQNEARPFAYEVGLQAVVADARRAPKGLDGPDYDGNLAYAYHLDADLLADLLMEQAVGAGVRHVRDEVVEVLRDGETGDISALRTRENGAIDGDFFIDCSGFASVLLQRSLGVPFIPFGDHLLCDRAVAMRIPETAPTSEIEASTVSTAQEAGWMWKIALQQRTGQGYVYSSHFLSDEEAERRLRTLTRAPESIPARLLRMRTGRTVSSWERNCVAIGLSGGFIEPLESTGIHLIEDSLNLLARLLPVHGENPAARATFNRFLAETYDEIRDFIVLHYCLSRRTGSFWDAVRQPEHIPERLRFLLDLWSRCPPGEEDLATSHVFTVLNYQYVMFGMDWTPSAMLDQASRSGVPDSTISLEAQRARLLSVLPSHRAYLQAAIGLS